MVKIGHVMFDSHQVTAPDAMPIASGVVGPAYQMLDRVIAVSAPLPLRIRRVLQRDSHRTEADVAAIVARQMDEAEKLARADYVVHNDEKTLLIPQVLELDRTFRA